MSSTAAPPHWTSARERSNRFALWLIVWIALHLGRPVARLLLHPITAYFVVFSPKARRQSKRYLNRVLDRRATLADGYRHVYAFAACALDRIWFVKNRMDAFELEVLNEQIVDDTLAEGRGAFLLGAHIGSFEALHSVGASRPGLKVAMVMYPENARMIHGVLQAIAPEFEMGIIAIGTRGSTLQIRDWLDNGGLVGLLGDRFLPNERPLGRAAPSPPPEGVELPGKAGSARDAARSAHTLLPFLGVPAPFSDGPFRLAMLLKRRVVFMAALYRGGNRYQIDFDVLADFNQPPEDPAERERLVREALERYVQRLEVLVRKAPYNWFNFHDFWHEDDAAP